MIKNKLRPRLLALLILLPLALQAQDLSIGNGRFQKGDNPAWNAFAYDDGSLAVGIFNLNDMAVPTYLKGALGKIGLAPETARDLWRQQDIPMGLYHVAPHGVLYVKVTLK